MQSIFQISQNFKYRNIVTFFTFIVDYDQPVDAFMPMDSPENN